MLLTDRVKSAKEVLDRTSFLGDRVKIGEKPRRLVIGRSVAPLDFGLDLALDTDGDHKCPAPAAICLTRSSVIPRCCSIASGYSVGWRTIRGRKLPDRRNRLGCTGFRAVPGSRLSRC